MEMKFDIVGQNFKRAGEASFEVKHRLKLLGLPPEIIRRVATAAYEGELNVIIYAQKGSMRVNIQDHCVEVCIEDTGPGIPDIELAMKEGYTTAPPHIKQLGYGGGMGLPNIKKNADWMDLQSEVHRGTTLKFRVNLHEKARRGQ